MPTEHSLTNICHYGRGGAGNYRKLSNTSLEELSPYSKHTTTTATPSICSTSSTSSSKMFLGGRGGAGNFHPISELAMFYFDEELEAERHIHEHLAPVYSIGRGGVGNLIPADEISTRSLYYRNHPDNSPRSTSSSSSGSLDQPTRTNFSLHSFLSGADKLLEKMRRS